MWRYLLEFWKIRRRRRALLTLADLPPRLLADVTGLGPEQFALLRARRTEAEVIRFLEHGRWPG